MRWRFLRSAPDDGPGNMALDEALMERAARTGDAVFRVYAWSRPTLSLGRNQRARDAYDLDVAHELGIAIVRRPTGGRALLHHHEITYSVTRPLWGPDDGARVYALINAVLIDALARLGVQAKSAVGAPSMPPGLRPCFDAPSEHEIVVGTRKLVGSAQWRRGGALLQHGSILIRDDQGLINRLLRVPGAAPLATSIAGIIGREPELEECAGVLRAALQSELSAPLAELDPDGDLDAAALALRAKYRDDAWTWRR